ncbi:MAG: hypothetical protein GY730_09370 [bacterium]|nr:hypothetical protein [bacterium]
MNPLTMITRIAPKKILLKIEHTGKENTKPENKQQTKYTFLEVKDELRRLLNENPEKTDSTQDNSHGDLCDNLCNDALNNLVEEYLEDKSNNSTADIKKIVTDNCKTDLYWSAFVDNTMADLKEGNYNFKGLNNSKIEALKDLFSVDKTIINICEEFNITQKLSNDTIIKNTDLSNLIKASSSETTVPVYQTKSPHDNKILITVLFAAAVFCCCSTSIYACRKFFGFEKTGCGVFFSWMSSKDTQDKNNEYKAVDHHPPIKQSRVDEMEKTIELQITNTKHKPVYSESSDVIDTFLNSETEILKPTLKDITEETEANQTASPSLLGKSSEGRDF